MNRPGAMTGISDRGMLMAVMIAVFAGVVLSLAGRMWPVFLHELAIEGVFAGVWLAAAWGVGAAILRAGRVAHQSRAFMFATAGGLGLGAMSLVVLGLGLAGWLNRGTATAIVTGGIVAGLWILVTKKSARESNQLTLPAKPSWAWLLTIPPVGIAIVAAVVPPGILWGDEPHGYDVLEYHLQVPREWFEMGRIVPLKHNVFSYFPFNVEMHYLLAMYLRGGPWAGMYLAQLMHVVFFGLTIVTVYGAARPQATVPAALAAATTPWIAMLGPVAYNEGGLLLSGSLAIAWAMQKPQSLRQMILAGAMAGFACGTKLTAVLMVLGAVFLAAMFIRQSVTSFAVFLLAGVVTFSPWLVRNAVWIGNPVFPEAMSLLGCGHFSQVQVERWQKAHEPPADQRSAMARAAAFARQIMLDWRYGFALLPLGIVAAFLERTRTGGFLVLLLGIQAAVWIGLTHLQGRFFVLSIPIAAMLIGQVVRPWWSLTVITAAGIELITGIIALSPRVAGVTITIGQEDLRWSLPPVAANALDSNRPVMLLGDARAFLYQVPMSGLKYRTVFDVDILPGQSVIDAWAQGAQANSILIVDPNELRRFAKTYWMIPMIESDATEPFTIALSDLPKGV